MNSFQYRNSTLTLAFIYLKNYRIKIDAAISDMISLYCARENVVVLID